MRASEREVSYGVLGADMYTFSLWLFRPRLPESRVRRSNSKNFPSAKVREAKKPALGNAKRLCKSIALGLLEAGGWISVEDASFGGIDEHLQSRTGSSVEDQMALRNSPAQND